MKKKVINVLRYLLFLFLVLVVVFPILFIFMSSFKTTEEIYGNPWAFPQRVRMDSYIAVFTEYGILRNLINSVIYSSITCIVTVIVSAMASYAIARMRWKLSKLCMTYLLMGIMIPIHSLLVPLYISVSRLHITNVGNMFSRIKQGMENLDETAKREIHITDILAVDTMAPVRISGALAGETCLEKAVGIAAMVKTRHLPMQKIAEQLRIELGVNVMVAGVEAVMASLGALTTPGTSLPLAILDMGGGSTDAAVISEDGKVSMTHQAGAGELVSMLIGTELGLGDRHMAEQIKKYPLAKVESLFHMRMENGQMTFVEQSIDPRFYGRVVLLTEDGMIRLEQDIPMEKIVQVRREAKRKVFVTNAFRALKKVAPGQDLKHISNVVLVGGSAEDFEIPEMLMEELSEFRIVCGRGNIRGEEGPRNAVATGLVLSYIGEQR